MKVNAGNIIRKGSILLLLAFLFLSCPVKRVIKQTFDLPVKEASVKANEGATCVTVNKNVVLKNSFFEIRVNHPVANPVFRPSAPSLQMGPRRVSPAIKSPVAVFILHSQYLI